MQNIVVVGPGALGCLLAANLSRQGREPVWLLDHDPDRAADVQQNGLTVERGGQVEHFPVRCTVDPALIGAADLVLLTVKSMAVPASLPALVPLLDGHSLLLAFQNGIGHLPYLRDSTLPGAWGLAVTSMGATQLGPGRIRFGGAGRTVLGLAQAGRGMAAESRLAAAARLLNDAGMETVISNDILSQVWNKLLANVGINALTAIHDCENGGLLERPEALRLLRAAVLEAATVATAKGIPLPPDPVAWVMVVCRSTATNLSSMLQDVRRRRPTEIDAINGAVLAEAKRLELAAPVNAELVVAVKAMEQGYLADSP